MARRKNLSKPEIVAKQFTIPEIDAGIRKIRRRVEEVNGLATDNVRYDDARVSTAEMNIRETIREVFDPQSPEFHDHQYHHIWHGGYIMNEGERDSQQKFLKGTEQTVGMLEGLIARLEEKREDLTDTYAAIEQPTATKVPHDTRRVFIVHGHDEGAKLLLAHFIEQLDLEPIILSEQPNEGRTVVEKFEANSDVAYAVVLLTPDDIGHPRDMPDKTRPRARQNVILELGYFVGRLSRARVCALLKGSVEIPSDIHGVVYISIDEGGGWKLKLASELKQAGIEIDLNKAV